MIRSISEDRAARGVTNGCLELSEHLFMNTEQKPDIPVVEERKLQTPIADELTRVKIFLGIQALFLGISVFTGGFNFKLWSMLDTAARDPTHRGHCPGRRS